MVLIWLVTITKILDFMRRIFLSLLQCLILPAALQAQEQWNRVATLPPGGNIMDMASDNSGTIYALTSLHSNVYYSADNGLHWTQMPNTSDLWNANCIEVDKVTGTLFLGSLWFGVEWTTDKGLHWHEQRFHSIPGGFYANVVRVGYKHGTNTVVAAEPLDGLTNIFITHNAGASWTTVSGLPWGGTGTLTFLADGTLMAGVNIGVMRSTNDGATWTPSGAGIGTRVVYSIAENTSNGHLFAGAGFDLDLTDTANDGVYRSDDHGDTWTNITGTIANHDVRWLEYDAAHGMLYAMTSTVIYASANEGATWTAVSSGIDNTELNSMVQGPGGLYTGTTRMGVMHADTPTLAAWQPRNNGLSVYNVSGITMNHHSNDMHTIDLQNSAVYKLAGNNWTHQYDGLPVPQFWGSQVATDTDDVIYAAYLKRNDGAYRSMDNGATWTNISAGIPGLAANPTLLYTIKVNPYTNDLFLIGRNPDMGLTEVYRSTDKGDTWSVFLPMDASTFTATADLDFGHGVIYVTNFNAFGGVILETQDLGATFDTVAFNLGDLYDADIVVAPNDTLYMEKVNHVYKRRGVNDWVALPDGAWSTDYNNNPLTLYADKASHLFASSYLTGVYYTANDSTWTDISLGLPVFTYPYDPNPVRLAPNSIVFTADNVPYGMCTFRYADDDIRGVYRFSLPSPAGIAGHNNDKGQLALYPNPATDRIAIKYDNYQPGHSTVVQVYNTTGQLIMTGEINATVSPLDISQLLPGTYFLKLVSGGQTYQVSFIKL